jgi:hypothetical protein
MLAADLVPLQGLREAVSAVDAAAWYGDRRRDIGASDEDLLAASAELWTREA